MSQKGLDFLISPKKYTTKTTLLAKAIACQKLKDQGQKAEFRNSVAGILLSTKPMKSNNTTEQRKPITQ